MTQEQADSRVTVFRVAKMDCAAEESLVRLALQPNDRIDHLDFDLGLRQVSVTHRSQPKDVLELLAPLYLDTSLVESRASSENEISLRIDRNKQSDDLKILLGINGVMFVVEIVAGILAQSTGLIADSLDMLADASVYAISLLVVYRAKADQRRAAQVSGWLQALLAAGVLLEVIRRAVFGSEPESIIMLLAGGIALIANVTCLAIIHKHREGGVHMKASWIFSANDVIANGGVILAGALVLTTGSHLPDLVIGMIIGLVVLNGARRILALSKPA